MTQVFQRTISEKEGSWQKEIEAMKKLLKSETEKVKNLEILSKNFKF